MRVKQPRHGLQLAIACLALATAAPATADPFRCGSLLVTDGDTQDKVRSRCGEPTEVTQREILRRPLVWIDGRPYLVSNDPAPVAVEFWTYNFGPNRLMRRLRFEDGILTEIETLGHGYRQKP